MKDYLIAVQVRMNSSRLPGKALLPLGNFKIVSYLHNSLLKYFKSSEIVFFCANSKKDVELHRYFSSKKILFGVGDEKNVFSRYKSLSNIFPSRNTIRITADNPFIPPSLIKSAIHYHMASDSMFSSTRIIKKNKVITRFFPKGFSIDIFKTKLLEHFIEDELDEYSQEHVIPPFYNELCFTELTPDSIDYYLTTSELKDCCSIDTPQDYHKALRIHNERL